MKPKVAIVGRPNVGKSTLFNRLVGRRKAIVADAPGVTRDRHEAGTEWEGRAFTLVDTGGFVPGEKDVLLAGMGAQAQKAVDESDAVLFTVDGRGGPTPVDEAIADALRRSDKPVFVVVNKMEGGGTPEGEFWKLGFPELFPVSAEHGHGVTDLMDRVVAALPAAEEPAPEGERSIRVAIVGRPNVGKSTLVNALLGEERFVASALPGTTRDAIDATLEHGGRRFTLTDTAGIRRKSTIALKVEKDSVSAALAAIEKSDVAVLVIDATEPGVDQDARIAQLAEEKGRALMLVVNKWDLVGSKEEGLRAALKERFKFVGWAPVVFTSALRKKKIDKVLEVAGQLYDELTFRAPTPRLNRLLQHLTDENPAPIARGKPLRLYYIAQVAAAPPVFTITCNLPREVPDFYARFIVNQLRGAFRLRVPIRVLFRERPGQAKRVARKRPK